jgi:hypothetical protein
MTENSNSAARPSSQLSSERFLGHADSKTNQIYAHYAHSEREVRMVNDAFAVPASGERFGEQIEHNSRPLRRTTPKKYGA